MGIVVKLGVFVALAAITLGVMSGTGYKMGWWELGLAFKMLRWTFYAAGGAAALGLVSLIFSKQRILAVFVMLIGGGIMGFIYMQLTTARSVPPIHDITTDTVNPPKFVKVVPLRGDDANSIDYATKMGPPNPETGEVKSYAEIQKAHYTDIKPLTLALDYSACFGLADDTAQRQGWDMVNSDEEVGLIEATDTTFWFGFKDDVVIRVADLDEGCRIDMRSSSRVGTSDVGVNAKRIKNYLGALEAAAG